MFSSKYEKILIISLIALMLLVTSPIVEGQKANASNNKLGSFPNVENISSPASSYINTQMTSIPYAPHSVSTNTFNHYKGEMNVMISFKLSNESKLLSYLSNLSNPNSPQYHKYLSREEFVSEFSPSLSVYKNAITYFSGFPGVNITTYSDRISLLITAKASMIGKIFNTKIKTSIFQNSIYYATSPPELPAYIASSISYVSGLTNAPLGKGNMFSERIRANATGTSHASSAFLEPVANNGVQYIYGSDLQVAYDEQSLLNVTFPTNEVIATILWSGYNSSHIPVGPFYPSDIYAYYNATLPSFEPHPVVYGVPINGAPRPGISASYDISGAASENTLDLEMIGSTAPGSSIFNVYGNSSSQENTDQAIAYILNPNSSFPELNKVSVISNSWGTPEYNDTTWYEYLQEAQARGITVVASSGDSGDNPSSSKYFGTNYPGDYVEFPSSMAYNSFGITAVGGTTLTLNLSNGYNYLQILNQTAWYISSNDTSDGGPAGSTGGISQVSPEPIWQLDTESNSVINGQGRGVPDIAAIANNTIIFETVNGTNYWGNPYFYLYWGTSIAAPVIAGIVAEIDAVLSINNQPPLGFLNPLIYKLANIQFASLVQTAQTGYEVSSNYNSSLPDLAFSDVVNGRNHIYSAKFAYDLVTGWGSINAYNLTVYILNENYSGYYSIAASAVKNVLKLDSMSVTSYYSNGTVNDYYNASIQQNFFLADSFGTPIYWVQNVIYISGSNTSGFNVNYSGWVVYPFEKMSVYEYNFPVGKVVYLPKEFNVITWLSNLSLPPLYRTVNFEVNSQIIRLSVPGAAYIIDSYNYSYLYNGNIYTNRLFLNYNVSYPGWLSPQFALVGGPSLSTGYFESTTGTTHSYIEPMGYNQFIPTASSVVTLYNDQTGEDAADLLWTYRDGFWTISISNGSKEQGVASYFANRYFYVNFTETGLPSNTAWSINFDGITETSTSSTISFVAPNGTYYYNVSTVHGYKTNTALQTVTINGNNITNFVTFTSVQVSAYRVVFVETGLPSGTAWYVNVTGQSPSGAITTSTFSISLPNGSYSYIIASGNKTYKATPASGSFTVNGASLSESISFVEVTYSVTFTESNLPSGTVWYMNLTNGMHSGPITGSSYSFSLSNGTYSFTIATRNNLYRPSQYSGIFTINGQQLSESITFFLVTYTVTFTEAGLLSGYWYVNITGLKSSGALPSSQTIYSTSLTNGSYSYSVSTGNKIYRPSYTGTFTVNGAPVAQSITFSPVNYSVTFIETGLPPGTSWSVTVNGTTKSSTGAISFMEPNGTYYYTVMGIQGFRASTYSGNITVEGSSVNSSQTWTMLTYPVTITEQGIPTGTSWSATLTGTTFLGTEFNETLTTTTNSITFNEPNGTYSYVVHLPSGYVGTNMTGSFTSAGQIISARITAHSPTNYSLIIIVVLIIAVAVLAIIVATIRRKNKK
ncbi:MAG: S53 family peptidase [Thermoplasmatales archaeon]